MGHRLNHRKYIENSIGFILWGPRFHPTVLLLPLILEVLVSGNYLPDVNMVVHLRHPLGNNNTDHRVRCLAVLHPQY